MTCAALIGDPENGSPDEQQLEQQLRAMIELENISAPAVGTVEECRARCLSYPHALYLTTLTEVSDIANLEETLATRAPHEAITREALAILKPHVKDVMVLSTEACAICEHCAYPGAPCRHPELMFPCVESHGIIVTALAEKEGIEFYGGNLVTWFSLLLFRE